MQVAGVFLPGSGSRRASGAGVGGGGGGASRMLLTFEGESLVHRVVRRALRVGLSPVIVVVADEPEGMRAALADLECECLVGPRTSRSTDAPLHVALRRLDRQCDAAVVMDGEMVKVTERMIGALVAAARRSPAPLVVSRYGQVTAPPLLFRRALFGELLASNGQDCGGPVVQRHRDDALYLDWAPELAPGVVAAPIKRPSARRRKKR